MCHRWWLKGERAPGLAQQGYQWAYIFSAVRPATAVERVWLYLRERFLSLRFLPDTAAIIEACCRAWNALTAEPGRIRSLCAYPWITKLAS